MEIGGEDIIFDVTGRANVKQLVFDSIVSVWPCFVVEFDHLFLDFDLDCFIYPNSAAKKAIFKLGCVPEWENALVHVMWKENELTVVVGTNKDDILYPEIVQIVDNLSAVFTRVDI